jgi:amidohydrolase
MNLSETIDIQKIINWRRHMHMYPEISFKEYETAKYIAGEIAKYPDVEILHPAGNSVIGVLKGGKSGKTVGLRADFDALPITEEADVDFKSRNPGVAHVCGHDCHAAMLLGALDAMYKIRDELSGTVKFIFQHAEEQVPGGAQEITRSGALNDVQAFYASHVFPDAPAGTIKVSPGCITANTDSFHIKIFGTGAHGAMPEKGIDSLLIGTEIVQALNFIISRCVSAFDNAVLTIGSFHAGAAPNIVPDTAEISGTVRSLKPDVRDLIEQNIKDMANAICTAYGALCETEYERGDVSVVNDEKLWEIFKKSVAEMLPDINITEMRPMMGGEDFSAYQAIAPSLFVSIGAGPKSGERYVNHHPKFLVDEEALPIGTALYIAFATGAL